jgi:hypothetical protein
MFNPRMVLAWGVRSGVMSVAILGALHVHAAVLPLSGNVTGEGVGMRAGLLDEPMSAVSGHWVGRTGSGRLVSLVLRVSHGVVLADATLDGVASDTDSGPRPLVAPTVTGRRVAFSVLPTRCAKSLARGVVTFESKQSAQLDLQSEPTSISVRLSKVG